MDLLDARLPEHARHPWERARFAFFRDMLSRHGLTRPGLSVLDAGAGDGWFARRLLEAAPGLEITCWDIHYREAARDRGGIRYQRARPEARFDVVLMLDLLEHVADDHAFLGDLVAENLSPGGFALLAVPAWPALFSAHDRALRHFRRYTPAQARAVLASAGLRVVDEGGLFPSLILPRLPTVVLSRLGSERRLEPSSAAAWGLPGWVTSAVDAVLAADLRASALARRYGVSLPGLSYWALAVR